MDRLLLLFAADCVALAAKDSEGCENPSLQGCNSSVDEIHAYDAE